MIIACCTIFIAALLVSSVQGLLQASVSVNLEKNVDVRSTGWRKITTWRSPPETGHIVVGTTMVNGNVAIPYSGIYLAFITVTLNGADGGGRFKIKLIINDKINNSRSDMTSSSRGGPLGPKSLSVKGAIMLQCSDFVSVYVYSETDSDWSISGQSQTTLSLQYIGGIGNVPGFSSVFHKETSYNNSKWNFLREWRYENRPGFFKSMSGFSKHVGEFVAICSGIFSITANVQIKTNATNYFDLAIALNSVVNGSTVRTISATEFTLSTSTSLLLNKGDVITLQVNSNGHPFIVGKDSSFSGVRLRGYQTAALGFSTVLGKDVTGNGGGWIQIPLSLPTGTSNGQFKDSSNTIASGRYYAAKEGIFIISASIRVIAESLISSMLFTRTVSASSISGNIAGIYSGLTKSDHQNEVTFTIAGTIQLASGPLALYLYMQNAGKFRVLQGSRISVALMETKYPAFHVTLDSNLPQSSENAWVEVTSWKPDKAIGAISLTDSMSTTTGRYTTDITGIYLVSSNIVFNAVATVISMLITVQGSHSKRNALFSTKGDPANTDTISASGALQLNKGEFISVWAKVTGTPSWSVGDKSSFSVTFLGLPFSVPGFSTVFASTKTFTTNGWHQITGLTPVTSPGSLFHYGGGLDSTNCKYQAPLAGIYNVHANLKLKQATSLNAEFILNVAVDNTPGSTTYLNGINDYILRSASLGSEDFYSMNVAGVLKLSANQNVTLWIKSTSAGTWQLSEDSSFSIVLIHAESNLQASGFQAVLSPSIAQTETSASSWKIVRHWQTARENSQYGLFKLDKYQNIDASSGTVTVLESGLYFISALITLKDAAGKFEVGIHIQSRLAGLFSIVDSSKLSRYTFRIFGLLHIAETQALSVMVRAPIKQSWEQDVLYCGLSFVKVSPLTVPPIVASSVVQDSTVQMHNGNWSRVGHWRVSETEAQYLVGNGYSKETGVFTVKHDGIYLVSGFVAVEAPGVVASIEMKITLKSDAARTSISDAGIGIGTVVSNCNGTCPLYASGVVSLKAKDTVAIFIKSSAGSHVVIKRSSSLSVVLVSEAFPLPNGMHSVVNSPIPITVKGNKQVSGWKLVPSAGGFFGSTGDMNSFLIRSTGVYFVSLNVRFRGLLGLTRAITSIVNIPAITSVINSESDAEFVLSVSGCMKMTSGSFYTATVYSETDLNYEITVGSSRSALFLGTSPEGFTATQSKSTVLKLTASSIHYITGWSTTGKDWLYESGSGFGDRRSFIVQRTGTYYVASHVILKASFNASGVNLTLAIERNGFIRPENGLYTRKMAKGATTTTLVISGNVYLEQWTQLKLAISVSDGVEVEMNIDSTFSIVKLSKDLSVQKCTDDGPNVIGKLTPEALRTSFKRAISWQCEAVGKSVSYSWLKDFKPIPGITSSKFQIQSTSVSDSGQYVCVATSNGVRVASNIGVLTIYDPMPEFLNPVKDYNLSVPENGPNTLAILFVKARASSFTNSFAMMSFRIVSGNVNNSFALSPLQSENGVELIRQHQLDREQRDNYSVVISATNLEAHSVAMQQINLTVTDLNDNAPIFTRSRYETSILENTTVGTTVARVHATDRDVGVNADIKYWFIPSSATDVFKVNEKNGDVTLQSPVDRESRDLYVIAVKAYDRSFSTYSELVIRILDLNEHAPVFNPLHYVSRVSEVLLPGTAVVMVTASDNDTGVNADLSYEIVHGDPENMFRITKYGVIQNRKTLNYERNTSYLLTISVRDNGQPPLRANKSATVTIKVTDANDNSPRFSQLNYAVNIFENATRGENLLTVHAADNDAPGQPESTISYSLEVPTKELSMFVLNSSSGNLTLNTTLDYEKVKLYRLTVIAKDAGSPPLQDKAQIQINVIDVNDNKPHFVQSQVVMNITESSQINREVYKVTARDIDSRWNSELRYSLESGNIGNTFTIDPVSGIVIAINPLDHEKSPHFTLKISCNDLGHPRLTSSSPFTLYINVIDENDNPPVFDSEKYFTEIAENTAVGSMILKLNVSDPDSGLNGNFSLTIKESSSRAVFRYDREKAGLILIGKLDYEKQSLYQFSIVAKDFGTPSLEKSASVEIHVVDVNDNRPSFSQSQYDAQVSEMVFANVTIFHMTAKDSDVGPGRRITYEIVSGDPKGQFRIGKYDGIVETVTYLNTTFVTMFRLEIIAKDGFTPAAVSNSTYLNIHVTKTPTVAVTEIRAGITSLQVTFDVSEFAHLNIERYEILVQEYIPEDINFNFASSLKPIMWYEVFIKSSSLNRIRRYVAKVINAAKRKRRDVVVNKKIKDAVIGNEVGCEKKTGVNDVCNGPLHPNKQYRLQVSGYVKNSKFPRDSHFSVPIQLGKPVPSTASLADSSSKDGTIGLAIAFAASTIFAIVFFIIYVQFKRKHQITDIDHVNRSLIQNGAVFLDPMTQRTGFDSLSDIGIWPKMSAAATMHQSSHGTTENFLQIPRSPGDSGINQVNDDDDSWKASDDEAWDNQAVRKRKMRVTPSVRNNDLQRQTRALRGISDSNTSLDSNVDNYRSSSFSENLRFIFKNEEEEKRNKVERDTRRPIQEKDDKEMETEFGPELETSFGADADLSSIDEENFEDE